MNWVDQQRHPRSSMLLFIILAIICTKSQTLIHALETYFYEQVGGTWLPDFITWANDQWHVPRSQPPSPWHFKPPQGLVIG